MKIEKILISLVSAIVLFATQQPAFAEAVVALSDEGKMFLAGDTAKTTEQNTKIALKGCQELNGVGCRVVGSVGGPEAVALSEGVGGQYISSNINPQVAMNKSLEGCNKSYKNCKFRVIYWVPETSFASLGDIEHKEGDPGQTYFSHNFATQEEADNKALTICKEMANKNCIIIKRFSYQVFYAYAKGKISGAYAYGPAKKAVINAALNSCQKLNPSEDNSCKITMVFENPAPTPEPKNFKTVYAKTLVAQREREEARNQTNGEHVRTDEIRSVSCHNQCMNGDCIRTFPGGRKERWQAPRVYDSMSGDWKWETNSCGQ